MDRWVGGRAGDYCGRRRILRIGLVAFSLASLLAATSSGASSRLAARGLQGIASRLPSSIDRDLAAKADAGASTEPAAA
jgi:MFS family permease